MGFLQIKEGKLKSRFFSIFDYLEGFWAREFLVKNFRELYRRCAPARKHSMQRQNFLLGNLHTM